MFHLMESPAATVIANGANNVDQIGVSIGSHFTKPCREFQAIFLVRRFGLMPATASLVASYAFGGAE